MTCNLRSPHSSFTNYLQTLLLTLLSTCPLDVFSSPRSLQSLPPLLWSQMPHSSIQGLHNLASNLSPLYKPPLLPKLTFPLLPNKPYQFPSWDFEDVLSFFLYSSKFPNHSKATQSTTAKGAFPTHYHQYKVICSSWEHQYCHWYHSLQTAIWLVSFSV